MSFLVKLLSLVVVTTSLTAVPVFAQSESKSPTEQGTAADMGMPDSKKQAIGCMGGIGIASGLAFQWGATEAVMLSGGALFTPSANPILLLGMMATLVNAACSLGYFSAPLVFRQFEN
ncbi:exported hypothetical protein [uncultured Gammaproteobacteria bacterium]